MNTKIGICKIFNISMFKKIAIWTWIYVSLFLKHSFIASSCIAMIILCMAPPDAVINASALRTLSIYGGILAVVTWYILKDFSSRGRIIFYNILGFVKKLFQK